MKPMGECDTRDLVTVQAPAKINLTLEVLEKRPDGYHDIRSVVVPIGLCDQVRIFPTDQDIVTSVTGCSVQESAEFARLGSDRNLATRAATALRKATGVRNGARIDIEKRIPLGGGLGGGSSDAAAVLVGLNRLWETGLSQNDLMSIGAGIGADVPALLHGGPVQMEGIGERVCGLEGVDPGKAGWWIVLVNPGINVSTRDIYSRWQKSALTCTEAFSKSMVLSLREGRADLAAGSLYNGLQETVFRKYPLIQIIHERLLLAGSLGALLCGSGASVFGLAGSEDHAHRIAEQVTQSLGSGFWVSVTRTLPDGVMVAHGPLEA